MAGGGPVNSTVRLLLIHMRKIADISLTFLFLLAPPSVLACDCKKTPDASAALKEAHAVFSGRFIAAEYRPDIFNGFRRTMKVREGTKTEYEVLVLKFEIERMWKGSPDKELILITETTRDATGGEWHSDCEYEFREGERYLVYAYHLEGGLETNTCTRTKPLAQAEEDLKVLAKLDELSVDFLMPWTKSNKSLDASRNSVFLKMLL
jgi:hypothetical protein